MESSRLNELTQLLGYEFKDVSLLETALTHSSYVNEHAGKSYERLEFLGDSLLNFLSSERLYKTDMREGEMSETRARTVSRRPLAAAVERMGLTKYMNVGASVNMENVSDKCKSDVFESILGALYLDSGDFSVCREYAEKFLFAFGETEKDYKGELQRRVVREELKYLTKEGEGGFISTVMLNGEPLAEGAGKRKVESEESAAKAALAVIDKKYKK